MYFCSSGLYRFLECTHGEQADTTLVVKSSALGKGEALKLTQLGLFYGGGLHKGARGDYKLSNIKDEAFAVTSLAAQ